MRDGRFRRHPSRQLFEDVFADDGDLDVLRMHRRVQCPTLIIRCTKSVPPAVLEPELDTAPLELPPDLKRVASNASTAVTAVE